MKNIENTKKDLRDFTRAELDQIVKEMDQFMEKELGYVFSEVEIPYSYEATHE